jgi:hypothetical protein
VSLRAQVDLVWQVLVLSRRRLRMRLEQRQMSDVYDSDKGMSVDKDVSVWIRSARRMQRTVVKDQVSRARRLLRLQCCEACICVWQVVVVALAMDVASVRETLRSGRSTVSDKGMSVEKDASVWIRIARRMQRTVVEDQVSQARRLLRLQCCEACI